MSDNNNNEKGMEWLERAKNSLGDDAVNLYNVACVYSNIGRIDEALDCLEKIVRKGIGHPAPIKNDAGAALAN